MSNRSTSGATTVGIERRATPRYPVDTRLFACIDGHTVVLKNIGRDGVAIHACGLPRRDHHLLELHLNRSHISLPIEVIETEDTQLLHARFLVLEPSVRVAIDQYLAEC